MKEDIDDVETLAFGQFNFEVLEAYTSRKNAASLRLMEKMKFQLCPNRMDEDNEDNQIFNKLQS